MSKRIITPLKNLQWEVYYSVQIIRDSTNLLMRFDLKKEGFQTFLISLLFDKIINYCIYELMIPELQQQL